MSGEVGGIAGLDADAKIDVGCAYRSPSVVAELGPKIKARAAKKHGIVGDQGKTPTDRRRSDPEVGVVETLVERVTDQPTLVSELRDRLSRFGVHLDNANVVHQLRKLR